MIIAISQSTQLNNELQDCLNQSYIAFLASLGCVPLLIPNTIPDASEYAEAFGAKALVLTGGRDCAPDVDGDTSGLPSCRDRIERQLLTWATERRLPVIGICRGFHFLNVFFGGQIAFSTVSAGHVGTVHGVQLTDPAVAAFFGCERPEVNSFHNNAVYSRGLAIPFRAFATAEEDIVEGAKHCSLPVYGIQWHPERPGPNPRANADMLKSFLGLARGVKL